MSLDLKWGHMKNAGSHTLIPRSIYQISTKGNVMTIII